MKCSVLFRDRYFKKEGALQGCFK